MELRHLRYFVAVAEELHFGRAAARLGIAQPPLSQQIQGLERELGLALFARVGRRVELTAAGRAFLSGARATLAQAVQAVEAARRAARGETGRLAVGFVASATYGEYLPGVLREFRERYPEVALSLEELTSVEQAQRLVAGTLDVGFVRTPVRGEGLVTETIRLEPVVAALPAAHPLAGRPALDLAELADEPFVLLPRPIAPGFHDQVIGFCREAGFHPRVAQEAAEMHTIISLVAAGLGASLVPASVRFLRRASVAYVPLASPPAQVELALACRHDDRSPVLAAFQGVVGRRCGDGPRDSSP